MGFLFERPINGTGFLYYENGARAVLSKNDFLIKLGVLGLTNGGTGVSTLAALKTLLSVSTINDSIETLYNRLKTLVDPLSTNSISSANINSYFITGLTYLPSPTTITYKSTSMESALSLDANCYGLMVIPGGGAVIVGSIKVNTAQIILQKNRGLVVRYLISGDGLGTYNWSDWVPAGLPTLQEVANFSAVSGVVSLSQALDLTNTTEATTKYTGALKVAGGVGIVGQCYADKFYGAVYNDYAEYRLSLVNYEPGTVLVEDPSMPDYVTLPTEDNLAVPMVVSDTNGFCIGEFPPKGAFALQIAQAGRVLVKLSNEVNRESLKPGTMLKATPYGTATVMSKEDYFNNPEFLLGYVSSIPKYEYWSENMVPVNNRVWIRSVR